MSEVPLCQVEALNSGVFRSDFLFKNIGPYRRTMPRALWWC
jgi:hypothetical protein